jgi:hypothetical protein
MRKKSASALRMEGPGLKPADSMALFVGLKPHANPKSFNRAMKARQEFSAAFVAMKARQEFSAAFEGMR